MDVDNHELAKYSFLWVFQIIFIDTFSILLINHTTLASI